MIFRDLIGNITYSWTSSNITYINNQSPFVIYLDSTCEFYNGILYDITPNNTTTYLDFKNKFNL